VILLLATYRGTQNLDSSIGTRDRDIQRLVELGLLENTLEHELTTAGYDRVQRILSDEPLPTPPRLPPVSEQHRAHLKELLRLIRRQDHPAFLRRLFELRREYADRGIDFMYFLRASDPEMDRIISEINIEVRAEEAQAQQQDKDTP
jgi:hypothetical protein